MKISETMIKERDQWLATVSEVTGVDEQAIMGKSRVESVAMARHLLIWTLHTLRGYSYPMVGDMVGRSAANCIHSNNVIECTYHTDEMKANINKIKAYNNGSKIG